MALRMIDGEQAEYWDFRVKNKEGKTFADLLQDNGHIETARFVREDVLLNLQDITDSNEQ